MALAPARSSVIAHSLLPFPSPRAGLAPFAARQNAATAELSHYFRPAAISVAARGACPVRGKTKCSDGRAQSLFSPCCHFRRRARGLPRSRQDKMQRRPSSVIIFALLPFPSPRAGLAPFAARQNAATAELSHYFRPAAISGAARGACPVRGKTKCSDGRAQSLFSPCCHFRCRARGLPRSRQDKMQRRPSSVIIFALLPFPSLQAEPREHDCGQQERDHRGRDRGAFA